MRTFGMMVVVVLLAGGLGGCGGGKSAEKTERFTQGGVSMEPAVKSGQVITVRRVDGAYSPRRGDVVVFHQGEGTLLKRVIAVGGETVACCDVSGSVTVNGVRLDEPYVVENAAIDVAPNPQSCASRRFGPVTVAKDALFVMGDNRARSNDSRCGGAIPVGSVFGVMTEG
ncbi:signal peptidase I [Dactylosporangium sp. AC04546]|uniref:signal peptidase I n=1 Tax=Dactylosporangium sp. AC04546 TaxID=2862460 RepID=UPI001EDD715E|nr:signal peptidase I [Dactylosporangium sp. AC04546]WVK81995.1 signal peptidase I [Dactylosporangium sp. AC04546]